MKCKKCYSNNPNEADFCESCGASLIGKSKNKDGVICCPKCRAVDIQYVTIEKEDKLDKKFAICGFVLAIFDPIAGLDVAGTNKKEKRESTFRKCTNCGHVF